MSTYTVTDGQSQSFSFKPLPVRFESITESDDINVSGAASIDATATGYEGLTVNLAANAHLTASFHLSSQNTLNVKGDASTSVTFAGTSEFGAANNADIQPDVLGTATLIVGNGGLLDFARGAAAGISVQLPQSTGGGVLVLEQPGLFLGSVDSTQGIVALRGLGAATDYDLSNGVLTIYGGPNDQVLDTLRFVDSSPRHAGTLVTLSNGEVDLTENTGTGPFNGGTALTQHVAPPPSVVVPPAPQNVAVHDNTIGADVADTSTAYSGPVAGIVSQFISITPDNLNVSALADNLFIHTGAGNDGIALHGGTNVVDAGTGSNFITSGGGFDTIFLDGRNIPATASAAGPVPGAIWNTVQNFGHSDAVTLFGVGPGTALSWQKNEGAVGHTGLTLHANLPNGSEASLTLAGINNTSHLTLSYGQTGGASYLYIKAT